MAQMPTYYIMHHGQTMPETVASEMPSEKQIKSCEWLTELELQVYASEYSKNTFQGGLQWYRCATEGINQPALSLFAGQRILVPTLFLSGKNDWGIYQTPGAMEHMRDQVCASMEGIVLVDQAGHWVQQEQSTAVLEHLTQFLKVRKS
jgi:pimeloyl-ACP methyl ester carboxylesterase